MPRPRKNPDSTASYIHAADVFTRELGMLFVNLVNRSPSSGRAYTFTERAGKSLKTFGPELCAAAIEALEASGLPKPWRVYFPKDWDTVIDFGAAYANAKKLWKAGFPSNVIAAVLGLNTRSFWRNIPEIMHKPENPVTPDLSKAAAGWDFLIGKGKASLADDETFCALVAQALEVEL